MDFEQFKDGYVNKWTVSTAAVLVVCAIGLLAVNPFDMDDKTNVQKTGGSGGQDQQQGQKEKVKLSNTKYAPYTYKISDDKVTQEEKRALAGFTVSKSTSSGVTTVRLDTKKSEYRNQTYKLKNGEELYFIETSMGDDSGGREFAMEDDQGVVVDSDGYILRS